MNRPEILAPAGDAECLQAALAAGADAIYFGLDEGFNARARADNFSLRNLSEVATTIRREGARSYLTLNTLLFESELDAMERVLRQVAHAGIDAIIVQDPAVALLAAEVCQDLEVHASTQMTISSPEAAAIPKALGIERVVVPRELSVGEIRGFKDRCDLELEVFIHGALCVSWSGQCLTSEAWGGRSANRGQCAQACRLPYDLVLDDEVRDLGDVRYLLSPKDLSGARALPRFVDCVHGIKIEGRQKSAQYVATAVAGYRRWVDGLLEHGTVTPSMQKQWTEDERRMTLSYTRGFSDGFLGGSDHQHLVEGRFPKHRGHYLGEVERIEGDEILVETRGAKRPWTGAATLQERPDVPQGETTDPLGEEGPKLPFTVRAGMGLVIDAGHPEDEEIGGPIFTADRQGTQWRLGVRRRLTPLERVSAGSKVWITKDASVSKDALKEIDGSGAGRIPLSLSVRGVEGAPLLVVANTEVSGLGPIHARAESETALTVSTGSGLAETILREKLGALGGTPFHLAELDTSELGAKMHLPVSELKRIRRKLVDELSECVAKGPQRTVSEDGALARVRERQLTSLPPLRDQTVTLIPLCRTEAQLRAALEEGLLEVELDWMEMAGLTRAVDIARSASAKVTIATVRVQKPGEEVYDQRIARLAPDGVLVRHWGALVHFSRITENRPAIHGDFSLNVTNSVTARFLLGWGLDTITPSHDLDAIQLRALFDDDLAERTTVTVHHHIPMFHTEHCVYAHLLSAGRDWRSCGRPCEHHSVSLRDREGAAHPVIVDVECRNTVFNAPAQSASFLIGDLRARGVSRFRVEFVRESQDEAREVLRAYRDLLGGRIDSKELVSRVGVQEQYGVTRGTMQVNR